MRSDSESSRLRTTSTKSATCPSTAWLARSGRMDEYKRFVAPFRSERVALGLEVGVTETVMNDVGARVQLARDVLAATIPPA